MNDKQKKVIPLVLGLFIISVIYVPNVFIYQGGEIFAGWTFIWDMSYGIDLMLLITEWIFIGIFGGGLFLYYK